MLHFWFPTLQPFGQVGDLASDGERFLRKKQENLPTSLSVL
jgi:hypothetical protein